MAASTEAIVLVGLPGSGKSTTGPLVAELTGRRFIDLDAMIEAESGVAVRDFFALHGEQEFRRLESELTERLASQPDFVLAPGGGWVLRNSLPNALLVWLQVTPEEAFARLGNDASARPLLHGDVLSSLKQLHAERAHAYQRATLHIDTNGRTAREVAAAVVSAIEEYGKKR